MATKAVEDVDAIYESIMRRNLQRYGCKVRRGEPASECWCYRAGPQGTVLPCPPPENAETEASRRNSVAPRVLGSTSIRGSLPDKRAAAAIPCVDLSRYGCKVRCGEPAAKCWCYRAGPQGTVLPCPPPENAETEAYCCY